MQRRQPRPPVPRSSLAQQQAGRQQAVANATSKRAHSGLTAGAGVGAGAAETPPPKGWGVRAPDKVKEALRAATAAMEKERAAAAAAAAVAARAAASNAEGEAPPTQGQPHAEGAPERRESAARDAAAEEEATRSAAHAAARAKAAAASERLQALAASVESRPLSDEELLEAAELVKVADRLPSEAPSRPTVPSVCGIVTGTSDSCRVPMRQRMRAIQGVISRCAFRRRRARARARAAAGRRARR